MKISVERMIQEGNIDPLRWGMNDGEIARVLPGSIHAIRKDYALQCPFLYFDGIEFYFEQDFYQGLDQLIIQVGRITPRNKHRHRYFDLSWLSKRLTYRKVLGHLQRLGWAYEVYAEGVLLVQGRALFAFYDDEDAPSTWRLGNIVLVKPEELPQVRKQLVEREQKYQQQSI